MEKLKKIGNHIFIDGLSGMALGLFATLLTGTIIQQIGLLIGGGAGDTVYFFGKMAAAVTGAGIGVGTACKFKNSKSFGDFFGGHGRYDRSLCF